MDQFSSNEQVSLQKTIETNLNWSRNDKTITEYYELNNIIEFITKNSFKTVCLQFPDYMLQDSYQIAQYLNKHLENNVYIMADSSYESCCVDYITAQHINADAIVHFGPRCSSEWTETIPCLCIYEKEYLNTKEFIDIIKETFPNSKGISLKVDSPYLHLKNELNQELLRLNLNQKEKENIDIEKPEKINIYIGENNRNLLNYQLKHRIEPLYYFNPKQPKDKIKTYNLNQLLLKKRYFLSECIKDSKRIGIVIATLVIKNFLKAIERVKKLLKLHGKKYYVINVGKPTVAKLANFPEMDVYVLVCCPSSNIFESRDFYKPIVTLYDVEFALNSTERQFSYEINADFLEDDIKTIGINNPDVSLLSGDVRWIKNDKENDDKNNDKNDENKEKEIVIKDKGALMLTTNSGGEFLTGRSFKGLEQKLGETEVKIAKEGRKGIAQGYKNEMF